MTPQRLAKLTHASRVLDEILNRSPNRQAPYVGEAAFATKAGIHASAILKEPATYEHVQPESVGNRRRVLVSDQAGKSNLIHELERLGVAFGKDDARLSRLLEEVKAREALGYAYEGADASFVLLARRVLGEVPQYFTVDSFRVMVEKRHNALGKLVTVSEATVRVFVSGSEGRCGRWRRATAPSTRSTRRCARTSAATRATSRTSSSSTTRCASSPAAPRRSRACWWRAATRARGALVHGGRIAQHRRRLLRGPDRFHHLQAGARRRRGGGLDPSRFELN